MTNLRSPTFLLNFLVDGFLVAIPCFIGIKIKKLHDATVFLLIYLSIVIFGVINETRVYNILIPFMVFLSLDFVGHLKKTSSPA